MSKWPTKPLGEVCNLIRGVTFKRKDVVDEGTENSVVCFRTKNVQATLDCSDLIHIPDSFLKRAEQVVQSGDSLISIANSHNLVGKVCYVPKTEQRSTLGGFISAIRPIQNVMNAKFCYYWLSAAVTQARFRTLARQTTNISNLPIKDLVKEPIPVPPTAEQERIVRFLDEAEGLRQLRQQADHRTAQLIPALFHQMFGSPTNFESMDWPFYPVSSFAYVSYGLAQKLNSSTSSEDGTRILTISNVSLEGTLNLDVEKYSEAESKDRAKAQVQALDLLFNWRNGSETHIGKTVIWENQIAGELLHVSFLLKVRADQTKANPYYLWVLINRLRATGFFTRNSRMQINRKFNASELSALELPLPPIDLQNEFANRVAKIREMEAAQAQSQKRLDDLFQSLLHRAFNGEL